MIINRSTLRAAPSEELAQAAERMEKEIKGLEGYGVTFALPDDGAFDYPRNSWAVDFEGRRKEYVQHLNARLETEDVLVYKKNRWERVGSMVTQLPLRGVPLMPVVSFRVPLSGGLADLPEDVQNSPHFVREDEHGGAAPYLEFASLAQMLSYATGAETA